MFELIKYVAFMTVFGALSSGIGGVLSSLINVNNKKILASLFEITAGIMTGIVCFDMIPESIKISNIFVVIIGIFIGIYLIYFIDYIVSKKKCRILGHDLMPFIVMLSMGVHNMIEGIAIGSSISYSKALGFTIFMSIFLHDIPEGMVVGLVSKSHKSSNKKIILDSIVVGMVVGIGVFLGKAIGGINDFYTAFCLSISGGSMLYIVVCDLIPNSKEIIIDKKVSIMFIVGIILSILVTNM